MANFFMWVKALIFAIGFSHFSADYTSTKEFQMCQKTAHVNFETTPSDFGAQIRESQQIKALSPLYNRRLRKPESFIN